MTAENEHFPAKSDKDGSANKHKNILILRGNNAVMAEVKETDHAANRYEQKQGAMYVISH